MKCLIARLLMLLFSISINAQANTVSYQVNGESYEGYYISPDPDAPLILLVHDWDGLTDYEIQRANMLADLGYAVFAADLFGAGVRPTKLKEKQTHTGELYKDREKMRRLLIEALKAAKSQGANVQNAVAMGYCFGGATVLELARSGADLKGFITFHGVLESPKEQNYSRTKGEILVFHGTKDDFVSMEQFANLAKELQEYNIPHELITYGGAPHGFTVFGTENYMEKADRRSWVRFTRFLEEKLSSNNG